MRVLDKCKLRIIKIHILVPLAFRDRFHKNSRCQSFSILTSARRSHSKHGVFFYCGWLRNSVPVKNGGKHPIIQRLSSQVVKGFFHQQVEGSEMARSPFFWDIFWVRLRTHNWTFWTWSDGLDILHTSQAVSCFCQKQHKWITGWWFEPLWKIWVNWDD